MDAPPPPSEEPLPEPSNPDGESPEEVTLLLHRVQAGDSGATEELLAIMYEQLRATAGNYFRLQSPDHTLQPTALVHEAYLKLVGNADKEWEGRAHFSAVASTAMRHILRDHARGKRAAKRSGDLEREGLTHVASPSTASTIDLLALDEALSALHEIDERDARIVELRYFGGLTHEEIARVLEVTTRTVERSWRRSRAWIKLRIDGDPAEDVD